MSTYTEWEETPPRSVIKLKLDAKNPRLFSQDEKLKQRELIAELVEHEDVYELAKEIVEHGFSTVERMIGVREDGKIVIVEGNRRLSALKLLLSPELAPEHHIKKFKRLADQIDKSTIKNVKLLIAPSRLSAAIYIRNKHTQIGMKGWKPIMQARFYLAQIDEEDMSIGEIATHFGVPKGRILDALQLHDVYEASHTLDLPDEIAKVVEDPRVFNASVLERLIKNPEVVSFLGIGFDEQGRLHGSINPEEFKKGLRRIVTDTAKGKINTRTLNSAKEIGDYLSDISADKPNKRRKGSFDLKSLKSSEDTPAAEPIPKPVKKKAAKKVARPSTKLIPKSLKCNLENKRTKEVFEELQAHLNVEKTPIATSVMLRILLEECVSNYLDQTGRIEDILEAQRKKGKPKDWYPSLSQMLKYIVNQDDNFRAHPHALKVARQLIDEQDKSNLITVERMNSFVHNKFVFPDAKILRNLWAGLEKIFEVLLEEPEVDEE